jgi:phosphoserine phosphatase RsbU/P
MQELAPQRILIVDDASENIDIVASTLTEYKMSIALNGEKALKLAMTENPPDLILLDIMMPGMDGYEVCQRLKADEKTKDIPIIFLTAKTDTESVLKGFDLGAVDYVTKPFNTSELIARVNTQMALKRSSDAIARHTREIEKKKQLITDSINYAKRIQNAILPGDKRLSEILKDFFVFYRPKDIVSGDFYWARKMGSKVIIIGADCTGHGVPGAFMSMFGVAFLNEIVGKENVTTPAVILNKLREMIVQSLRQNSGTEVKDGMDMAVITIDNSQNTLEFSGAQNPMYLVRDKELIQIKGDRMPVSIYDRMDDFTNHTMGIKENDQIYLFSDGYADQFGGPAGKKFKYKAFKELIVKNCEKPMKEQNMLFGKAFDEWKGEHEQIDDLVIFGIKI